MSGAADRIAALCRQCGVVESKTVEGVGATFEKDTHSNTLTRDPAAFRLQQSDGVDGLESVTTLKGKTLVISGASRGIGLAIGVRAAKDGANVAILAKTTTPHPRLPGTIYTAAKDIEDAGGKALPIACDIRDEAAVKAAVEQVVAKFGGIDIVVNNASAISLTPTEDTEMKRYDLMHSINTRGTFLLSKCCIPFLRKGSNPHILNISPPLNMETKWFAPHVAYTMAKYGMSMCALGMAGELRDDGIAVNTLWPRTAVATSAVKNLLGGIDSVRTSRTPEIMSDSAYLVLTSDSKVLTGQFLIDDEVLLTAGVTDMSKYNVDPKIPQHELMADFFC